VSGLKVGVIGAGKWGTALASVLSGDILLYSRNQTVVDEINKLRTNQTVLPDLIIPDNVKASANFNDLSACEVVLIVTPSQTIRGIAKQLNNMSFNGAVIVCSKGLEQKTLQFMYQAVLEEIGSKDKVAVLSGPNFAHEVAGCIPSATTIAASEYGLASTLSKQLSSETFKLIANDDLIGTSLSGVVKNVLAIGSGAIIATHGLGENTRAAFIAAAINELLPLYDALGANRSTLFSMAGIGDIMLSCYSDRSRNMSLGMNIMINNMTTGQLTEGSISVDSLLLLAEKYNIDLRHIKLVQILLNGGSVANWLY
jgi:glycerol-3-phosphate dehydrogenase (NAD(P)+)